MDSLSAECERTFQYDDHLPSLPLPSLEQTLTKYLESVKPFLSDTELKETARIVQEFKHGVGQTLHTALEKLSKTTKNWLSPFWEKMYHENRIPVTVLQNYTAILTTQDEVWPLEEGTQLKRGAIFLWHQLRFYLNLRREKLKVDKNRQGVVFNMNHYRRTFHCCRVPGEEMDSMFECFKTEREGSCPSHIHVMCNGHIFKMIPFDEQGELLTAPEIQRQLAYIKEKSKSKGQCVGTLPTEDRVSYAKALEHLKSLDPVNRANIDTIFSSIIGFVLDAGHPQNNEEACKLGVASPTPEDRWSDKSNTTIVTENGFLIIDVEHSAFDGMATVVQTDYIYQQIVKDSGDWPEGQKEGDVRSNVPMPTELVFSLDETARKDIQHASEAYHEMASNYETGYCSYQRYGKDFLKKHMMHPDTSVQLAIQLAYYTEYNRPGACYETATTRQFYRARTETMRSCTMEAIDWCKAMLDPQAQRSTQLDLLQRAHNKHNSLMTEAASSQGIDRHLLVMYYLSQEMGLTVPELYTDKAYTASGGGGCYVLSTSCMGYTSIIAAMSPMMENGYMCNYRIGRDELSITAGSFKKSPETGSQLFLQQIATALDKIGDLLLTN